MSVIIQQRKHERVQENYQVGSLCLIFSRSTKKWFSGCITEIKGKGNNEWLTVKYCKNKTKQIQRNCSDIKPIPNNHHSYFKKGSICMIKSDNGVNKWCFGTVINIFYDQQEEWLTIKYKENNIIKTCDIQRLSQDIKLIVENNNNDTSIDNDNIEQTEIETPLPLNYIGDDYNFENLKLEKQTTEDQLTSPKSLIGVKMVICSLKQHKSNSHKDKDENVPTPVSDKSMFKYFQKIDMGKIRVSSLSIDYSFETYASDDSSFNKSNSNENKLILPFKNIEANTIILSQSMDSQTESETESDSDSNMFDMLDMMHRIDQDTIYAKNGYKKIKKLKNILQGELLLVEEIKTHKLFVIKKTEIELFKENTVINDNGDYIFTSENRIKEREILKYVTNLNNNDPMNQYIIKYKDWFKSEDDYFLVIEYIESETNLKQFIAQCQKHIYENKLTLNEYHSKIKYVFWQLVTTIHWLHGKHICHLELFMENIMLINCDFIKLNENKNNKFIINNNISIKIIDFGVGEIFKHRPPYLCNKNDLSINNESYLAPNIDVGIGYHACKADMWSIGMVLFECMVGKPIYEPMDIAQTHSLLNIPTQKRKSLLDVGSLSLLFSIDSIQSSTSFLNNGYVALQNGNLKEYLSSNELIQYFDSDSFALLNGLLKINEYQRYNSGNAINHKWFSNESYCKTYINKIKTKQKTSPTSILKDFPFYTMDMKSI